MTDLTLSGNNGNPTMTSREIAELVNSRHDAVKKSAERLAADQLLTSPLARFDFEHRGNTYHGYRFDKRDSLVLVARLSPEFTAAVIDRWQELESQKAPKIPQTMHEALRLAADALEENAKLSLVARQQGDRIKSLQNLFEAGITPFEFAKRLNGVNCQQMNATLESRRWLYRDAIGNWRASSKARDLYLTERSGRVERSSGQVMVTATPVLLKRGAALLHKLYLHEQLPMKKTWDGAFTHDKGLEAAQ